MAAGVRRIEALTGLGAVEWIQQQREQFGRVLSTLGAAPAHAVETVQRLQAEAKRLNREVDGLKMKVALGGGAASTGGTGDEPQVIDGIKLIAKRVSGLEKTALRNLGLLVPVLIVLFGYRRSAAVENVPQQSYISA